MPRESPISPRMVLISFSDFLPKFFVLSSSDSVRLDEVGDGADIGGLEAVGRSHRQLELVHVPEQMLVELRARRRLDARLRAARRPAGGLSMKLVIRLN